MGAKRYDDAKRVIRQFFTFSILFAIVFNSLVYILKDYMLLCHDAIIRNNK